MKTKMIKKLFPCTMILGVFALLLGVSSCRDAAIPEEELAAGEPIRFDIGFAQGTRVTTETTTMPGGGFSSSWDGGEEIGIFAVRHVSGTPGELAASDNYIDNVRLTYNSVGEGSWSFDQGVTHYWPQNGDQLDFYAYYPYVANADPTAINFKVGEDQSGGYEDYYLIMASAMNQTKGANPTSVPLTFSHKMALVHVTILNASDFIQTEAIVTVTLKNAIPAILPFDLSTIGTSSPIASGTPEEIQMYRVGTGTDPYVFRALVPAQTLPINTTTFTIGYDVSETKTGTLVDPGVTLTAGNYSDIAIILTEQP